ncbi:hypothetical protein BDK51DRAFT_23540, partial [Blyttiomyces helicus]
MWRKDFWWLVGELQVELQMDSRGRREPLTAPTQQVDIGLYCIGHGSSYNTLSHLFNVAHCTALVATTKFVNTVNKVLYERAIGYPVLSNDGAWAVIQDGFYEKRCIPAIVGAIDGTHIPILKPLND